MTIAARIICDSIGPSGKRITTFECTYPRMILAEVNTHRALSKNSASSRAIPIEKMIQRILDEPAMPVFWGKNQKGMQAAVESDDIEGDKQWWLESMQLAVEQARKGIARGLHKQIVNRITEPFQHMVTVMTGTEWANFFHLRYHKAAQPEFQALAKAMYQAYMESGPRLLAAGEWHLPYIRPEDWREAETMAYMDTSVPDDYYTLHEATIWILRKVSTGRCARTSYVNQNGVRSLEDDIALHDRLYSAPESGEPGHWSPFEHQAMALYDATPSGNLIGWKQYRKFFSNENTTTMPVLER